MEAGRMDEVWAELAPPVPEPGGKTIGELAKLWNMKYREAYNHAMKLLLMDKVRGEKFMIDKHYQWVLYLQSNQADIA